MTAVQAEHPTFLVAAFYAFTPMSAAELECLLTDLPSLARRQQVVGSVLLAPEGVNGTISGPDEGVAKILECLRATITLGSDHYERLQVKRSRSTFPAFSRFKARRKREIVSLGQPCADPRRSVGPYVDPLDWNALVDDPDTLVIVIMDEAHYAATSCTQTRGLSAYGEIDKILKENRLDNLLVICGTATPWNLV